MSRKIKPKQLPSFNSTDERVEQMASGGLGVMLAASLFLAPTQSAEAARGEDGLRMPNRMNPDFMTRRQERRAEVDRGMQIPEGRNFDRVERVREVRNDSVMRTMNEHRGPANFNQLRQVNDAGRNVRLNNGANLDLTSNLNSITLGGKLFKGADSVTIEVGGTSKVVSAGTTVTAAEYVAVKQVLGAGKQTVVLDKNGCAVGGVVDVGSLAAEKGRTKVDNLVVSQGVTALADFAKNSAVRLRGDLDNYGSLIAYSSNERRTGDISAENITNQQGALISTDPNSSNPINLGLHADDTFTNFGTIYSSGDLTISAGKTMSNVGGSSAGAGSITAMKSMNVNAPQMNNTGRMTSAQSMTLDAPGDLNVLNQGGVLESLNGALNLRNSNFNKDCVTNLIGGVVSGKDVNLNSGGGLASIDVDDLIGTVNSAGEAVHVLSKGADLVLGDQCLIGDPTYFSAGNITINGNISVGEKLAILAAGNITSTSACTSITARTAGGAGQDIYMIAGAALSPSIGAPSTGTLPSGTPIGPTNSVRVTGASLTGGNIDLSASSGLQINANSTSGVQGGGNVTMLAFEGLGGGGDVSLAPNATINTSGNGAGAANGNIMVGGHGDITLGSLIADGGATTVGGNIVVNTVQPTVVGGTGGGVQFNANGAIMNGGSFNLNGLGSSLLNPNDINIGNGTNQRIASHGDVAITTGGGSVNLNLGPTGSVTTYGGDVIVSALGDINITAANINTTPVSGDGGAVNMVAGTILGLAGINASGVDITTSAAVNGDAGDVTLTAGGLLGSTVAVGDITANGLGTGNSGGDVTINAAGNVEVGEISSTGDNAGTVDINIGPVLGNLTLLGDITAGAINLNLALVSSITTPVDGVTFTTDALEFTGLLNVGTGTFALHQLTDGTPISLGGSAPLNLSALELGNLTAGLLEIGDPNLGGGITIDGLLNLSLLSGLGDITLQNAGDVLINGPTLNLGARNLNIDVLGLITAGVIISPNGGLNLNANLGINLGGITAPLQDVILNSDNGPINLGGLIDVHDLTATAPIINVLQNVTAGGAVDIVTNVLNNTHTVAGNVINITDLLGNGLLVNGTGGLNGTLQALNITIETLGGDLTFLGATALNGITNLNVLPDNIVIIGDGASVIGNNIVNVNAIKVLLKGLLTGSPLIFNSVTGAGTIANSSGDVNLVGDIVFNGDNFAVIASGNVNAGTCTKIELSNDTGDSGSLVVIAGYDFTPGTGGGQIGPVAQQFTIGNPSTTGGNINFGTLDIDVSTESGTAGSVLLVANGGTVNSGIVTVRNIDASGGASGNGGDVKIIAEGGVNQTGYIHTFGDPWSGSISVQIAQPATTPGATLILDDGGLVGGTFLAGAATAGNIALGQLDAGSMGNITFLGGLNANNTITVAQTMVGNNLTVNLGAGSATLPTNVNTVTTTGGGAVVINEANGIELLGQTATSLTVNAGLTGPGNITTGADFSVGTLVLNNDNGSIILDNAVTATTSALLDASVDVLTQGNGQLNANSVSLIAGHDIGVDTTDRFDVNTQTLTLVQAGNNAFVNNVNAGALNFVAGDAGNTLDILTSGNLVSAATFDVPNLALRAGGVLDLDGALTASTKLLLQSGGNLTNAQVTGAISTPVLALVSTNGNVGTDAANRFIVGAGQSTVQASAANGSVFVTSQNTTGVNLGTSDAKTLFDFVGQGPVNVSGNVSTTNGSISITAQRGKLQIASNVTVAANEGNVSLLVSDTNKKAKKTSQIVFNNGSTVQAIASAAGLGNLDIRVGAPQAVRKGSAPRKNFTVSETGGGVINWGAHGKIKSKAPGNSVTAKGANVTFTKMSSKSIVFNGNVTLLADPPVTASEPVSKAMGGVVSQPLSLTIDSMNGTNAGLVPAISSTLATVSNLDVNQSTPTLNVNNLGIDTSNVFGAQSSPISLIATETASTDTTDTATVSTNTDDSYFVGDEKPLSAIKANICCESALEWAKQNQPVQCNDQMILSKGHSVYAPMRDTEVHTPFGKVHMKADSLVLLSLSNTGLSVYNLHDSCKGAVRVQNGANEMAIAPAQHLMISKAKSSQFAQVNAIPTIAHRRLTTRRLVSGLTAHSSEFSIATAIEGVHAFTEIMSASHPHAKAIAKRMLKTCAVVHTLNGNVNDFQYHYKPEFMAMAAKQQ